MAISILKNFTTTNQDMLFKGPPILASCKLSDEYANGAKTGRQIVSVEVVCPATQFQKYNVKCIEMSALPIETEKLDELNANNRFVHVKFDGFSAELWQDFRHDNEVKVRATAKKVVLLDLSSEKEAK